jgi:DNA adenine methylase
MPTEADHADMLDALLAVPAVVVLSGYASPLYEQALAGWERVELAASTGQGSVWKERTEVLWSNRSLDTHPRLNFGGVA